MTPHGSTIENGIERCNGCNAEINPQMAAFITRHGGTYFYSCGVCGNVIKHEYKEDKL